VEFRLEFEPLPGRGIHKGLGRPTDEEQRTYSWRGIPWSLNDAASDTKNAKKLHAILRRSTIVRDRIDAARIRAIFTLFTRIARSPLLRDTRLMRQLEIRSFRSFRSFDILEESHRPVLGKSAFRCSPSRQISHVTPRGRGRTRKDASSGLVTSLLFAYIYIRVKGNDRAAPWNSRGIKGSLSLRRSESPDRFGRDN